MSEPRKVSSIFRNNITPSVRSKYNGNETDRQQKATIGRQLRGMGKARVWISRIQGRATKIVRTKWSSKSSLLMKEGSKNGELLEVIHSITPPTTDILSQTTCLPCMPPVIPLPLPHSLPLPLPPLLTLLPSSPAVPTYLLMGPQPVTTGEMKRSSTVSALSNMCFEFLQVDDRPTTILQVKLKPDSFSTADQIDVDVLFTNPAFEYLKPRLELDFKASSAMGGILKRRPSSADWVPPNGDWQLRCVSIGGNSADHWSKVLTVGPIPLLEARHGSFGEEQCASILPNDNEVKEYYNFPELLIPQKKIIPSEVYLENYGGGGEGDVRRISIAEEPHQDISASASDVTAIELGVVVDGAPNSLKTITPSYTRATNTARGSLTSSNSTSRRSSRSLPSVSRKGSNLLGVSESLTARSESTLEGNFGARPNMDWTRGEMLRKNIQNIEGMDDHLNHLMRAPWHESPMGPPHSWPISLRCIANVVMSFPHPAMVYWGKELIALYNPQAKILAGENHPAALGQPFADGFPKFKDYMMPMLQSALDGKTTIKTNEQIFLDADVPMEERYYNFIISPIIGASGTAEGVLKQAHPRTSQVIQARRIETLHKIRENVELIRDLDRDEFWRLVLEGLGANENDCPFAILYKVVSEKRCVLAGTIGFPDHLVKGGLVPNEVLVGGKTTSSSGRTFTGDSSRCDILGPDVPKIPALSSTDHSESMTPADEENTGTTSSSSGFADIDEPFLFFHEMILARESNLVIVKDLTKVTHMYKQELLEIDFRGFGDPCTYAAVIPIQPSPSRTFGYLILGLNPRRPYDNEYLMWLNMLMEQLATSIGRVRLLTEDLRRAVQEARHQKQLASQALKRKQQQENFIDISSHELRNPLSAVLQSAEGIIGLLSRHKNNTSQVLDIEQITDSAQTILLCVNHQRIIIEDILAVSKLDSNLMTVAPIPTNPRDLIWNGLKMFEAELSGKEIDWEFRVLEGYDLLDIRWVKIDPSRTTQILVNLVANAIKFTAFKEGYKKITVLLDASLESPKNWSNFDYLPTEKFEEDDNETPDWGTGQLLFLSVAVEDTGIGISKKNKRNLFQRFNQVPKTHITYGGSGLGLYISRRLCQLQGGNIGVSSTEGEGSTFRFYVKTRRTMQPVTPSTSIGSPRITQGSFQTKHSTIEPLGSRSIRGPPRTPDHSSEPGNTHRITPSPLYHVLVVEDNLINQKVLQQQLIMEGCVVYTANNGQEALEKIMQSNFLKKNGEPLNVVLMDMEMPIMGGVEATRLIRKLEREGGSLHVPIIGISANARPEQMTEMTEAGMDDAIPKPFRIPELLRKFKNLV